MAVAAPPTRLGGYFTAAPLQLRIPIQGNNHSELKEIVVPR